MQYYLIINLLFLGIGIVNAASFAFIILFFSTLCIGIITQQSEGEKIKSFWKYTLMFLYFISLFSSVIFLNKLIIFSDKSLNFEFVIIVFTGISIMLICFIGLMILFVKGEEYFIEFNNKIFESMQKKQREEKSRNLDDFVNSYKKRDKE